MSMITELINELRQLYEDPELDMLCGIDGECRKLLKKAANTIDGLSDKLRMVNTEQSIIYDHDGWIPCDEHLPEENEAYLCTIQRLEDSNIWTDKLMYYPKRGWIEESKDSKVDEEKFKILAWRPLLEPYSENKGQMVVERI